MKTKLITSIILLSFFTLSAQSKFSIGASGGSISVGDETGTNYKLDLFYLATETIEYQASFIKSDIEANNIDFDMYLINLGIGLNVFKSDKTELQPIMGFSFVSFNEDLNLENNSDLGAYFGANVILDISKKINYGFNTQITYARHSPGGILQANLFIRYKF